MNFEWDDQYLTGVAEIDAQHKVFLNMIKRASDLRERPSGDPEVDNILNDVLKYALFHFKSEEALMAGCAYPKMFEQKIEHDRIVKELTARIMDIRSGKGDLTDMLIFLVKWFAGHTTYADKELGMFIGRLKKD